MTIQTLTLEQEARLGEFRDRWISIGLCTDPADRPRAEAAILQCYKAAGLDPPKQIIWCGSPWSQAMTRAVLNNEKLGEEVVQRITKIVRASVRVSVVDSVWASVGASVWASVVDSVRASVRASVWHSVVDSVVDSVWASVVDSVWASVVDSVWASVEDLVRASIIESGGANFVNLSGYEQHDAHWLGFYEFFRVVCGLKTQTDKLVGLIELAKSASWWIPCEQVCFVSERHHTLHRDDRGRLHSLTGPAIVYPDGWEIYAVGGVLVPSYVITDPERITIEEIQKADDAEVRRILRQQYGEGRYLADTNAKIIDADTRDVHSIDVLEERSVTRALLEDHEGNRYLVGTDGSTGRAYYMLVPRQVSSCSQAHNALCGFDESRIISQS